MGMDVYVPCPISTLCMISVTRPSRSTRMKALGSKAEGGGAGSSKPSSRPPPTATLTLRNSRRDTPGGRTTSACRRPFDGGAGAPINAAATDVPRHRGVDIGVGRMRLGREQRGGGHDLTRLAVAALHDLHVERSEERRVGEECRSRWSPYY